MTVTDSTFSGNHAYAGGSIYNGGVLTFTNSTISGNDSYWNGGGMLNNGTAKGSFLDEIKRGLALGGNRSLALLRADVGRYFLQV